MFQLNPPEVWVTVLIHWYYYWLNQDEKFLAALEALFRELAPLATRFERLADKTGLAKTLDLPTGLPPEGPDPAHRPLRQYWQTRKAIEERLFKFATEWPLPRNYALKDLWFSYQAYADSEGKQVRLLEAPRLFSRPAVGVRLVSRSTVRDDVMVISQVPLIFPLVPLPFVWDPIWQDRKWLNDYIDVLCADLRTSILRQAEEYERQARQAGFKPAPPAYHAADTLKETAQFIYLRAVKGLTWGELALKTGRARSTVIERTKRAASMAGIPLEKSGRL